MPRSPSFENSQKSSRNLVLLSTVSNVYKEMYGLVTSPSISCLPVKMAAKNRDKAYGNRAAACRFVTDSHVKIQLICTSLDYYKM